jgi:hypothetical protein
MAAPRSRSRSTPNSRNPYLMTTLVGAVTLSTRFLWRVLLAVRLIYTMIWDIVAFISLAITRRLTKTHKGRTLDLQAAVEFTITTTSSGSVTAEARMAEQVKEAQQAVVRMDLAPPALSQGQRALNDLNFITGTFVQWQPLLNNVQLFMNAVDTLVEVRTALLTWFIFVFAVLICI